MSFTCTGHGVVVYGLIAMKSRFALEMKGFKGRGPTMFSLIKKKYGFNGDRKQVYQQFCEYVEEEKKKLKPGEILTVE